MLHNIAKMREEGEKIINDNIRYDLMSGEMNEIYKIGDLFDVINTAYLVGLASGCRYGTRKERKKHLQNAAKTN